MTANWLVKQRKAAHFLIHSLMNSTPCLLQLRSNTALHGRICQLQRLDTAWGLRRVHAQPQIQTELQSAESFGQTSQLISDVAYGQVMGAQANFVRVRIKGIQGEPPSVQPPKDELLCVVRGLLKKIKQTVLVGDRVRVIAVDWVDGRGMVESVQPRDSELADPKIANVDQVLLVWSVAKPPFDPQMITRFLVCAEAAGLPVIVVLNKIDLVPVEDVERLVAQVVSWGYTPVAVSSVTGQGMEGVEEKLCGKVSVLAGPSGVGKSSVINALRIREASAGPAAGSQLQDGNNTGYAAVDRDSPPRVLGTCAEAKQDHQQALPALAVMEPGAVELLATGTVSEIGRGRHTTRNVTLLDVAGGLLADTPGFNQPKLDRITPPDLADLFPEIRTRLEQERCAFSNCQHANEPGCAMQDCGFERHPHYVELLDELKLKDDLDRHRSMSKKRREGNVRYKTRSGGEQAKEALLDVKVHRRVSRNTRKQMIQEQIRQDQGEEETEDMQLFR